MTQQKTRPRGIIFAAVAILALASLALVVGRAGAAPWGEKPGDEILQASGVIEAQEVSVASQLTGLIVEIPVVEGSQIGKGDLLVQLDTSVIDAQIEAAKAMVAVAEAALAQAQAGASPQQIAVAQAQLAQAQAGRDMARQSVADTHALLENPQDINLQIAVTHEQLESARHKTAQALALKDAAELGKEAYDYVRDHSGRQKVLVASGPLSQLPPEIAAQFPVWSPCPTTTGNPGSGSTPPRRSRKASRHPWPTYTR